MQGLGLAALILQLINPCTLTCSAAQGTVIEARQEKGLGTVATTLVQRGTIRVGDPFIAGGASGKVNKILRKPQIVYDLGKYVNVK